MIDTLSILLLIFPCAFVARLGWFAGEVIISMIMDKIN